MKIIRKKKVKPNLYLEASYGNDSKERVEKHFKKKKRKRTIIGLMIIFILTVFTIGINKTLKENEVDISIPIKEVGNTIIATIKSKEELPIEYDDEYITEELLEREEKHFDYYNFTEEEYMQFNDITTYDILTPDSEKDLLNQVYLYCSEGNFIDAYQLLEVYVFEEDTENRKEKFHSMREDLNTMAELKSDDYYIEKSTLLPFINDPELLLYSFYDLELREQKEIVSIKDSDILPLPRSFLKTLEKVEVRPSELPNFSKQYNSISIKGKEIWRLEVAIGQHNIPEHYVYIIIDTENAGRNKVYYIEAQDNGLWVPTKYDQLN